MAILKDAVDAAYLVSVMDTEANNCVLSERAAQEFLRTRLIHKGYCNTLTEVDIEIQAGRMKIHNFVDVLINGKVLLELKKAPKPKDGHRGQLMKYMGRCQCKYGALIVFPHEEGGSYRAELFVDDSTHPNRPNILPKGLLQPTRAAKLEGLNYTLLEEH